MVFMLIFLLCRMWKVLAALCEATVERSPRYQRGSVIILPVQVKASLMWRPGANRRRKDIDAGDSWNYPFDSSSMTASGAKLKGGHGNGTL